MVSLLNLHVHIDIDILGHTDKVGTHVHASTHVCITYTDTTTL